MMESRRLSGLAITLVEKKRQTSFKEVFLGTGWWCTQLGGSITMCKDLGLNPHSLSAGGSFMSGEGCRGVCFSLPLFLFPLNFYLSYPIKLKKKIKSESSGFAVPALLPSSNPDGRSENTYFGWRQKLRGKGGTRGKAPASHSFSFLIFLLMGRDRNWEGGKNRIGKRLLQPWFTTCEALPLQMGPKGLNCFSTSEDSSM